MTASTSSLSIPNRKIALITLLLILTVFIGLAAYHIVIQPLPNQWDDSEYANATFNWLRFIEKRGDFLRGTFWGAVYAIPHHLPPMVFITSLLGGLINPALLTMHLAHLLWFTVLLVAAYGIGQRVQNRWAGVLSVATVGTLPLIFFWAKTVMGEPALFAAVGLLLWLLIAWGEEFNWWRGAVIGAAIGFGLLTKQHFIVSALGPLGIWGLWLLIQFIRERATRRGTLLGIGCAFVAAAAVAGPWYLMSWKDMLTYATQPAFPLHTLGTAVSWYTISTYMSILISEMGWPSMIFLAIGIVWACIQMVKAARQHCFDWRMVSLAMLLTSGLAGYVIAIYIRNINTRFVVPALVSWGILAGLALADLWQTRGKAVRLGFSVLSVAHLIFWWTVSFGPALPTFLTILPQDGDLRPTDMNLTWKTFTAFESAVPATQPAVLWVVGNYHNFNMPTFTNIIAERGCPWEVKELYHWTDTESDVAAIAERAQPGEWIAIYRQERSFYAEGEKLVSRNDDALLEWMQNHPESFLPVLEEKIPAHQEGVWAFIKK